MIKYLRPGRGKGVEAISILVLALLAAILSSCDESPLSSDLPTLSKEDIRRSILKRADTEKEPLIIESISDVEKMTLHGEKCWTALAYVKDGQGVSTPIYFVTKQGREDYIYGAHDLITQVEEKGYDFVVADIRKSNSGNSLRAPTPEYAATPESEPTAENVGGVIGARREIMDGHEVTVLPTPGE
jgi:hypothetical protein